MRTWDFFSAQIIKLAKLGVLPHLFILEGDNEVTSKWLQAEVLSALITESGNREHNTLTLSPSGDQYKLEDLQEDTWRSFFAHRPDAGNLRFIIFEKSDSLSERVANRLLKDLEDTPPWIVIFMLHSGQTKILPTIRSRAITWKLPKYGPAQKVPDEEFNAWLSELAHTARERNYGALPELLKSTQIDENQLMDKLHEVLLADTDALSYAHTEKWLEHLKWWHKSNIFHQAKWERLLPFCVLTAAKLES